MESFHHFELQVQQLCNPEDFKTNRDKLKRLRLSSYETLICLLKLGGEITTSIRAAEEIFKLSTETNLTEMELIELSTRFRFIHGVLDTRHY